MSRKSVTDYREWGEEMKATVTKQKTSYFVPGHEVNDWLDAGRGFSGRELL